MADIPIVGRAQPAPLSDRACTCILLDVAVAGVAVVLSVADNIPGMAVAVAEVVVAVVVAAEAHSSIAAAVAV